MLLYRPGYVAHPLLSPFLAPENLTGKWLTSSTLQKKEELRLAKERKELKWQKEHAYDDLFTEDNLEAASNQNRSEDFLDDFM